MFELRRKRSKIIFVFSFITALFTFHLSFVKISVTGEFMRYKIKPIEFEVSTRDQARFRLFSCV